MGKEAVNGNISGYWVWKHLMSQLCWQHAKIISPNKNPRVLSMSIAKPMEVELTWILFKGLKHFKLLILGFQIFKKLHSRPEL